MGVITIPNTFVNFTSANATEVNANFTALANEINGSLDASNLANNAVTTSKILNANVTAAKIETLSKVSAASEVAQSVGNNVFDRMALATEIYDTLNEFTNHRFTAINTGYYHIHAAATFDANATGYRTIAIYKNDAEVRRGDTKPGVSSIRTGVSVSCDLLLAAGDYIEVYLFQTSGANLLLTEGSKYNYFDLHRIL